MKHPYLLTGSALALLPVADLYAGIVVQTLTSKTVSYSNPNTNVSISGLAGGPQFALNHASGFNTTTFPTAYGGMFTQRSAFETLNMSAVGAQFIRRPASQVPLRRFVPQSANNSVIGSGLTGYGYGYGRLFGQGARTFGFGGTTPSLNSSGEWRGGGTSTNGYVGFSFQIGSDTHYGWIEVEVTPTGPLTVPGSPGDGQSTAVAKRIAYNDVPGQPIAAGQTAPVPVELVRFAAAPLRRGGVGLSWATASERDNAGWSVERSADGVAWAEVGFVAGAGDADRAREYEYHDDAPLAGPAYYRLRQQDYDGAVAYSEIVAVTAAAPPQDRLVLMPSLAEAGTEVRIGGVPPEAPAPPWTVYDALGAQVARGRGTSLPTASLAPGTYYVRVGEDYLRLAIAQ